MLAKHTGQSRDAGSRRLRRPGFLVFPALLGLFASRGTCRVLLVGTLQQVGLRARGATREAREGRRRASASRPPQPAADDHLRGERRHRLELDGVAQAGDEVAALVVVHKRVGTRADAKLAKDAAEVGRPELERVARRHSGHEHFARRERRHRSNHIQEPARLR